MYDELIANNIVKMGIKGYCENRFNKLCDPCETCIYRDRFTDSKISSCIFGDCPRDWDTDKN